MDSEQNNGKIQQIGGGVWHKQGKKCLKTI